MIRSFVTKSQKVKNPTKLELLSSISFIIFLLPFLRMCSDSAIESSPRARAVITESSDSINSVKDSGISQVEILDQKKAYESEMIQDKEEYTFNFYELIYIFFGKSKLSEYNGSTLTDKAFYPLFGFFIVLINSVLLLVFALAGRARLAYLFSLSNLIVFIGSTIGLFLFGVCEDMNQLRVGYYLFALNSILIVLAARKEVGSRKRTTSIG